MPAWCQMFAAKSEEGLVLEFYDFAPGILAREAITYDASLPPSTQPKVPKWNVRLHDCLDDPVFLNDGTAVVPCVHAVHWVTTEGKESRTLPTRLLHGRVSVDLEDHVLGFESAGNEPQFAHIGSQRTLLSLGHIVPSQPPVALPGERVAVVTSEEVIGIHGNVVEWRVKVARPEKYASGERMFDNQPNALGTLDGKVVVKWAGLVYALDERGEEFWRMNLGEPVVSNVVLTANGGVCVALNRSVHCELPE